MITIHDAILSLKPKADFQCGVTAEDVKWFSSEPNPTASEINAEVIRLKSAYDAKEYQRKRQLEYPSIADQLDDIYHNGIDAWKATIKATKDKYPKG